MNKINEIRTIQLPKEFWMHSNKTKNTGFLYSSPYSNSLIFSPNSIEKEYPFYADILYFSGLALKSYRNDAIPKIKGYCIDEVNLSLSKFKLFDYSYVKYKRCN